MLTNIIELIEPIIHEDFMLNLTNNEELNYEPENEDIYANALNSNGTYLDDIKKFIKINSNKLLVFHINVNSLHSKVKDIDYILKLKKIDILCVYETKQDKYKLQSFYARLVIKIFNCLI